MPSTFADTIYVHSGESIQDAIDSANENDEIIVSTGVYRENIDFKGKNITLRSIEPLTYSIVVSTIIDGDIDNDGNGDGSVVTFDGTETQECILSGFLIRNGLNDNGAGINGNDTSATIQYNVISDNYAESYNMVDGKGGGIYRCYGTIQYNIIKDNDSTWHGGGISECGGTIHYNTITKNLSAHNGGGLYDCDGHIHNNVISDTYEGGGLYGCDGTIEENTITNNHMGSGLIDCDGIIQNNIITGNSDDKGGGLSYCDGTIQENIICNNTTSGSSGKGGGLSYCDGTICSNIVINNTAVEFGLGGGFSNCDGTIQNNIIANNSARTGGGLDYCNGDIQNNTIHNNSATLYGGGIRLCQHTIRNCIIWQNDAPEGAQIYDCVEPTYSCIQNWTGSGTGNITDDPQLIDPDGPDDDITTWEDNDFHIQLTSPCIDTGCYIEALTQDFEEHSRGYDGDNLGAGTTGDGSDFDIGADEYVRSTAVENWMIWI